MFPERPRRPMFPDRYGRHAQRKQPTLKSNLLSMIQSDDGNLDFEKISTTYNQLNKIYGQVSPMISPVIAKFTKK
ncbi:YppG family protein [Oceanobacillus rekensis]|uniref:YppG family protein n=1 Tax=Oceanobacillus rekensis TaxID=937927 RepID=UPI000B4470AD|nr:YppG family protein [Oceanobacillus rekensis]